jgi:hypothetical protein
MWASAEQNVRLELLAKELVFASSKGLSASKMARICSEAESPALMAEIEFATAIHAAGGSVHFIEESERESADLEVTLGDTKCTVEVTSLRESQDRMRVDEVYHHLFDRCFVRLGFHSYLGFGGYIRRPPTHAEFLGFERQLEETVERAVATRNHQPLKIGDWLDITIAVPGVHPIPEGIGQVETLTPAEKPLDVLLARKIRAKQRQLSPTPTGGVLVVVDAAKHFPDVGAFMAADLTNTTAALSESASIRGILYALPAQAGPADVNLRMEHAGSKRMYYGRPIRVAIGAVGTIHRSPADESFLRSLIDAITQLENRLGRFPPLE